MADSTQEQSIQVNAEHCRDLFADNLSLLQREAASHDAILLSGSLQDEFGRFNLWAANIAVFAPIQASLDSRIREVPEVKDLFLRQLDTLGNRLLQLHEDLTLQTGADGSTSQTPDPNPGSETWSKADIVECIHEAINWLHRVSNLVRKASFVSQNKKAADFKLRDEVGEDLTERLTQLFTYWVKRECKELGDDMVKRLVETMILRRKRMLYRQHRQQRWAIQQAEYKTRQLKPLEPSQQVTESDDIELSEQIEPDPEQMIPLHGNKSAPSRLTVTTVDRRQYNKMVAPSGISRATTAPFRASEKALIPPPPIAAKEGNEFVCDYCCLILPSEEALDRDKWAKHIKRDLDPYVCIFDDCRQPYQIYNSSKEWLAHMRTQHRTRWQCAARDHPRILFEAREQFLQHMSDVHPGLFRKEQLSFIADSSAHALNPTIPSCPFCSQSSGDLEDHVGQHLRYFALQSIPWPDHLEQSSQPGSAWGSSSADTNEQGRSTLLDALDDVEAPVSEVERPHDTLLLDRESRSLPKAEDLLPIRSIPAVESRFGPEKFEDSGLHGNAARSSATPIPVTQIQAETPLRRVDSDTKAPISQRTTTSKFPQIYVMLPGLVLQQVDDIAVNSTSLCHTNRGKFEADCRFLIRQSQWGVLGADTRPAGIFYLEFSIHQPAGEKLNSATLAITLDENVPAPHKHGSVVDLSGGQGSGGWPNAVLQMTDWYGPRQIVGPEIRSTSKRSQLSPEISVAGFNVGGVGFESSKTSVYQSRWWFAGHLVHTDSTSVVKTIKWELGFNDLENNSIHSSNNTRFHLGFAFEHRAQPFSLKAEINGKTARLSERISSRLRFPSRNKNDSMMVVKFGEEYTHQKPLDQLARGLPAAMEMRNMESVRIEVPDVQRASFLPAKTKAEAEAAAKAEEDKAKAKAAEEAAAKAKEEAEELKKIEETKAKLADDVKKAEQAPIRFTDAVGRKFSFPFHLCATWQGMEELIRQAFLQVDVFEPHVQEGHYDLIGPDGEIILPSVWERVVQPDWAIKMTMWPMDKALPPKGPDHAFNPNMRPPGMMPGIQPIGAGTRPPGWPHLDRPPVGPRPPGELNIVNVGPGKKSSKKPENAAGAWGAFSAGKPPKKK